MSTQIFGEYDSYWGRVIREMRVPLNDNDQFLMMHQCYRTRWIRELPGGH